MFSLITIPITIAGVITFFFSRTASYIILSVPTVFVFFMYIILHLYKWKDTFLLSENATFILTKYGHYFYFPFASRELAGISLILQFSSIIYAAIHVFYSSYILAIIIAVAGWFFFATLTNYFNPHVVLSQLYPSALKEVYMHIEFNMKKN